MIEPEPERPMHKDSPSPEALAGAVRWVPSISVGEYVDAGFVPAERRLRDWQMESNELHSEVLGDGRDLASQWLADHADEL
jgi:hypothetical protein